MGSHQCPGMESNCAEGGGVLCSEAQATLLDPGVTSLAKN